MEEDEFLTALRLQALEVLLVGGTDVGQDGDGGLDDVAQGEHLTGLADASLEHTHLGLLVHEPYRQGHSYLGVVAARTAGHEQAGREQLVEPLLHHRLAVGSGDAHDGDVELVTVSLCQSLESLQRIDHLQEVCLRIVGGVALGHVCHDEVPHPTAIKLRDVIMTVIALRLEREEQCFFRETKGSAVGKDEADIHVIVAITTRTYQCGYLFNRVCHCL